jgi:hypothetical protein
VTQASPVVRSHAAPRSAVALALYLVRPPILPSGAHRFDCIGNRSKSSSDSAFRAELLDHDQGVSAKQ